MDVPIIRLGWSTVVLVDNLRQLDTPVIGGEFE